MIKLKAYDVEVLPNFFSITFVNIDDYLQKFKEACTIENKKGKEIRKNIPLIQKYKVNEIKEILLNIESKTFYITPENDEQLFPLAAYLTNLCPQQDVNNKKIYNHLFGYNSNKYDKLMVAAFLMYFDNCKNTAELITTLYNISKKIIDLQKDDNEARKDYQIDVLNKFKLPFVNIDIMTLFRLDKVSTIVKNDKKIYVGKSLKQTSINLQWYELLEFVLPPISEKDKHLYNKNPYKNFTIEQLNRLISNWDRYIIPEWIEQMCRYNLNDVFIVCEMIRLYSDEIKLRYSLTKIYEVDVLSASRSEIANVLFKRFYSEFSNLQYYQWGKRKTERTVMHLKKVISDKIYFKTEQLQKLLTELKHTALTSIGKSALQKEITINKLTYTMATGGIHSKDLPRNLRSKMIPLDVPVISNSDLDYGWYNGYTDDSFCYVHWDIASFYPSLMVVYKIAPEHLDNGVFVKLVKWIRDTRIEAKHSTEDFIDGIPPQILAVALKIVINAIYGKMGSEYGDTMDKLAVLKVTINGQLFILMLCEELELAGIEVCSANTDGIIVKLAKNQYHKFLEISNHWQEYTGLEADSEQLSVYSCLNVNNYLCKELNGKITYKGSLNPYMYAADLSKGYDMPIVAKAAAEYLLNDKPILETLYECQNILDFCKTQNIGKQFKVLFYPPNALNPIELQRNVRYYVSKRGGNIFKVNKENTHNNLCSGNKVIVLNTLDDLAIAYRNIDYQYYYNEVIKLIDPIKLGISNNQKGGKGVKSGKVALKKLSGNYESLFDELEE